MQILFDYQAFQMQRLGGVSRYCAELYRGFRRDHGITVRLPLRYTENSMILRDLFPRFNFLRPLLQDHQFPRRDEIVAYLEQQNRRAATTALRRGQFDVFHPTYFDPYFLEHLGTRPFVLTIHDMIHELFPAHYPASDPTPGWKRQLAMRAAHVLASSESTKRDILRLYGLPPERVTVVYLGAPTLPPAAKRNEVQLPERFVLFVGERGRYKNFGRFLRAFGHTFDNDPGLHMVCTGPYDFSEEERALVVSLGLSDRTHRFRVSDRMLARLYREARCLVFPSQYEGFGFTPLEAFGCGCPVVASNASSIPEVVGDAAMQVEPADESSIGEGMAKVVNDDRLREALRLKGFERLKLFPWEKTCSGTRAVYEQVT